MELLTEVEPRAAAVRAVNTVLLDGSRRRGFNTDITGLQRDLRRRRGRRLRHRDGHRCRGHGAISRRRLGRAAASATSWCSRADPRRPPSWLRWPARSEIEVEVGPWPPTADALAQDVVVSTVPADVAADLRDPVPPGSAGRRALPPVADAAGDRVAGAQGGGSSGGWSCSCARRSSRWP